MSALGKKHAYQRVDGRYVYWSQGEGPLVVLLHGWPVSSHHWRHLVPELNAAGFETLAIDLKGLGESAAADSVFDKKTLAKSLLLLLADVKPRQKKIALLGHDWGGSVAIAMAEIDPQLVGKLIIEEEIAPGLEVPLEGEGKKRYPTWHGGFHRCVGLAERLLRGNEALYLNFFLNLRYDSSSLSDEDRQRYLDLYQGDQKTATSLAYYRTNLVDSELFRGGETEKLKMPCLALGGSHGMGIAVGKSLAKIAPSLTAQTFEFSGHYPAEEEPAKFNAAILDFLL